MQRPCSGRAGSRAASTALSRIAAYLRTDTRFKALFFPTFPPYIFSNFEGV